MIVLQHNFNGTAMSTVTALEAAIERGAEVVCLQEP
jgi:DNA-binding MurR/RpiR family transcriptional regulator